MNKNRYTFRFLIFLIIPIVLGGCFAESHIILRESKPEMIHKLNTVRVVWLDEPFPITYNNNLRYYSEMKADDAQFIMGKMIAKFRELAPSKLKTFMDSHGVIDGGGEIIYMKPEKAWVHPNAVHSLAVRAYIKDAHTNEFAWVTSIMVGAGKDWPDVDAVDHYIKALSSQLIEAGWVK